MAASRPARPLRKEVRVIDISNENMAGYFLLLEMALKAESLVAFIEQSLVDRAVWRMARGATLTHRLVLVHKRPALRSVALKARFVLTQESQAASPEHLLNICCRAFDRHSNVRVMAIRAANFSFEHRMVMWQLELGPHFQVTLEAGFR
jgi:hypothetical protein